MHANDFRDRWGLIHARQMHPSFYDPERHAAVSQIGIDYLHADLHQRHRGGRRGGAAGELFDPSNLTMPYHSVNTDVNKRIRYLS